MSFAVNWNGLCIKAASTWEEEDSCAGPVLASRWGRFGILNLGWNDDMNAYSLFLSSLSRPGGSRLGNSEGSAGVARPEAELYWHSTECRTQFVHSGLVSSHFASFISTDTSIRSWVTNLNSPSLAGDATKTGFHMTLARATSRIGIRPDIHIQDTIDTSHWIEENHMPDKILQKKDRFLPLGKWGCLSISEISPTSGPTISDSAADCKITNLNLEVPHLFNHEQ